MRTDTEPVANPASGSEDLHGTILPLDVLPATPSVRPQVTVKAQTDLKPYSPERQRDYVRLIVACGLLLILGYLVIWSTIESASYPAHWNQTKEMLQIILPALIGIIGTVIGFYFGSAAASSNKPPTDDSD